MSHPFDADTAFTLILTPERPVCGQPLDEAKRCARHIVDGVAILATIARLADERDRPQAAKESAFATRNMRGRLSSLNEPTFSPSDEVAILSFLRRKSEQGKARREP